MADEFTRLGFDEKRDIVIAIVEACKEMWGKECMPAADIGDNRVFDMDEIIDWLRHYI